MVLTAQEAAAKPRPLEEAVFLARPPALAVGALRCAARQAIVVAPPPCRDAWVHTVRHARTCLYLLRDGTTVAGEERQREGQLADNFQTVFDACANRLRDVGLATAPSSGRSDAAPLLYPRRRISGCGGRASAQLCPEDGLASPPSLKHYPNTRTAQVRTHAGRAGGADRDGHPARGGDGRPCQLVQSSGLSGPSLLRSYSVTQRSIGPGRSPGAVLHISVGPVGRFRLCTLCVA